MTREKREINKKLDILYKMLEADDTMGRGFTPFNTVESDRIQELEDKLARLQGFENRDNKVQWQMENLPIEVIADIFEW